MAHATINLGDAARDVADDGRGRVAIRRDLGVRSFGVNAFYQASAGGRLVGEHNELNPGANGNEELYVVVSGSCSFTIDGEHVDAPQGTALLVAAESTRSAEATADETLVLVVGGTPGEPYSPGPGASLATFFERYQAKDYAGALAECNAAFEQFPGNALVYYNVACVEALLGHADESLAALDASLSAWPAYRELAVGDDDFASLRDDPRFLALTATRVED